MNKVFRVIWNSSTKCWAVVSELSSSVNKKFSISLLASTLLVPSCFASATDTVVSDRRDFTTNENIGSLSIYGNDTVNIINGASVTATDAIISGATETSNPLNIMDGVLTVNGKAFFNSGTININGANSKLIYQGNDFLYLSSGYYRGNGDLIINITEGGQFISERDILLAYESGSGVYKSGIINVSGKGSLLKSNDDLFVGWDMRGILNVLDGARAEISGELRVGDGRFSNTPNQGHVTISGNGSEVIADTIFLGNPYKDRVSTITIQNGGKLSGKNLKVNGESELIIGSSLDAQPVNSGKFDVADLVLTKGASGIYDTKITFNHIDSQYDFSTNIQADADIANINIDALNGTTKLSGNNSSFSGKINISSPAQIDVSTQNNLGNATIANDGLLSINSQSDWTFSNTMTGLGILDVNTGNNTFSFQNATDTTGFRGTLMLSDTSFDLSGDNTAALASALLRASSGSKVTVGTGTQNIDGLGFNGGTVDFGEVTPGNTQSGSMVHVSTLDLTGSGTVQVDTSGEVIADTVSRDLNTSLPLLEQDDRNASIQLVSVSGDGRVVGSAGGLQLQDQSGQRITDSVQYAVTQNGQKVAEGSYDYRLTSGVNNDGLYIGYGLTQLDLLTSGTDALVLDANGKTGNAADMSARITGTGDLAFNSQKGETVSLSNQNNDYTGVTDVRGGGVLMNSDSALGQTSEIRLAAGTMLDMNSHSQTAGKLNGAADSVLNINGGNLTLTEGGISAGSLTGSASLNISGGEFSITAANSTLTATTTVGEKATVRVHDNDSLGTGTVNTAGTLILGNTDAPVMLASSQVTIADKGTLSGSGGVAGNLTNSGTLDLRAGIPGNVLTVGGNYTGNNGILHMNTVLGDDHSVTDKLVIKGDASGQTRVAVTNAGGTGAQTLNGIELIHVDGNAGSAEFIQTGRIAAGAYDYTLGRGHGNNSGSWYLTSGKNTPAPLPEPEPKPEQKPGGYDNDLRPEAGSYTANMAAANTMFVTRLHERLGQMQYTDVTTGEKRNTSMWMRHEGGHNRWHDGSGQLKTQGNRYVVQLGGDIAQWGRGEADRWHLDVMGGYGNEHNRTNSVRTGYRSKGSVNGYSTGLYATWYGNDETRNGAYLDSWIQYSWFDNHVKGDGLPGESWKSKGLTASLETGYTWKTGEFSNSYDSLNEWYIQPQAQVIWMGVKADKHRESNGTRVESTGDGNIRTRLGVKTWIKGHNRMDDGKSREFSPFVEVNWLHNTRDFGTRMNGVTVHQDGARNIGEVKAGVEGQINDRLNLWGNVGVQAGDRGYSDTSAMLGVKYTF
ncbi:autotransporter outer membrane beta-barrel domain-containing protein [Escherichia albertii]|uniref:Autotransporter outer membrane beta-barrel domain-containing protein n=1 Tax=Escherichia albertii TaxID=208962 RepID=A0AAX3MRH6_ESCAL|nr:autotransporter outer membrane beta-barrel domain-containing protein [Escherichia albertii]WDB31968.1 autotransporter outer membrane beta-barrel domain-containing protein [Escherichia albertii]